jgi:hypothetical protein
MLSTKVRLRLEDIAARIVAGIDVSFDEMTWAQKWADHNRSAADILKQARRRAISGFPAQNTIDGLIDRLNLGDPDPSNHLIGPQDPSDLANWFTQNKTDDWRQHD